MKVPIMWHVRPAKAQISLRIRAVRSEHMLVAAVEYSMSVTLLAEQHLELLSFKAGYTGSSESTFVKMLICWKPHVAAHMLLHCMYISVHIVHIYLLDRAYETQGRTCFILFSVFRVLPEDDVNQVRQNISAYSVVTL